MISDHRTDIQDGHEQPGGDTNVDIFIVVNGEPFSIHDATEDADGVRVTGIDAPRLQTSPSNGGHQWVASLAASPVDRLTPER